MLSYPDVAVAQLIAIWPQLAEFDDKILNAAAVDAAYAVYLDKQLEDIEQRRREESRLIPEDFSYDLPGLSQELRMKLDRVRPPSIGHAERIEGMTPAAVALLLAYLRRGQGSAQIVRAN